MKSVKLHVRRPVLFYACLTVLSAGIGAVAIWVLSKLHRPIEYMIAGTFLTTVGLMAVLIFLTRRRWL